MFGGVVTNVEAVIVLISTTEAKVEVISDWGSRRKKSRDKDDIGAWISTMVVERTELKGK